jgi:hypothetical protein
MEDSFAFEKRQEKDNNLEYSKGGGGGSGGAFFRTNVYSKQCYSDPQNPGKMICKETSNSSGYDPFNQQNNFQNSKENVYTQEFNNNGYNNRSSFSKTDPSINNSSFFGKM